MNPRVLALLLAALLLFSAVPDTMAAPVLKELFVDRYGVGARGAQVFMAINLVGALAAIPVLSWARRRASAVTLVVLASIADGCLLLLLAAPIGFAPSLVLRALEGVTDVVVFAALFDIVRAASGGHAARGLGLASTPLLLGLGLGAVLGGQAAQTVGDGSQAMAFAVFGVSAAFCALVAALAAISSPWLPKAATAQAGAPAIASVNPAADVATGTFDDRPRPLWWSCAMAISDRATGGLITGTLPLVLADALGYTKRERGWLIGVPLLLMALCTGPAGALCDRLGSLRVRIVAGVAYAVCIAAIPLAGDTQSALAMVMVGVGLSGAMLF
ncbi:MAG: MFS transporter, partial [Phycisphaerae bacterium]|nr:MFS transporter [Phycisphaerae bacterium]